MSATVAALIIVAVIVAVAFVTVYCCLIMSGRISDEEDRWTQGR